MTIAALLAGLLQYGPSFVAMAEKLVADVKAGRANQPATPEDFAELKRLAAQSSLSIYAHLGIEPPAAALPKT